ncbi:ovarian-specific serine/threonine-protein kinase Lok-like [Periplaneta americana]|uniref:ovarian-specific serine/threonine-protein kinase Lok-like n=1 Tax=Periplaneta americana TaxID=6978 RepID=UPI0037E76D2D
MERKPVWGWLCPMKDGFTLLELKNKEYTVGKDPTCDYVINYKQLGKVGYVLLYKRQFKIFRNEDDDEVYLQDVGGTYVNQKKVGPGKKVVLCHNDGISVIKPYMRVFVFLDKARSNVINETLPEVLRERYLKSYTLGVGGFGKVSLIFDKNTGKRFAMKTVKKHPYLIKYAYTEAEILNRIRHPCIIQYEGVVNTDSHMFIVLEYMEGGDLFSRVHPVRMLQEADIKLIFYQLVHAIQYLHEHKIVHRDLKPHNILLSSKNSETLIKLADFGISKILKPGAVMATRIGTPQFLAPEILDNAQEYTKEVDIWGMGVLLYFSLSSQNPFTKYEDVLNGNVTFSPQHWAGVSSSAITLIRNMLQPDPTKRISTSAILAHEWLEDQTIKQKAHRLMWPEEECSEQNMIGPPQVIHTEGVRQQPTGEGHAMEEAAGVEATGESHSDAEDSDEDDASRLTDMLTLRLRVQRLQQLEGFRHVMHQINMQSRAQEQPADEVLHFMNLMMLHHRMQQMHQLRVMHAMGRVNQNPLDEIMQILTLHDRVQRQQQLERLMQLMALLSTAERRQ